MESLPCIFLLLGDRLFLLHWETHFGVNKIPSSFLSYDATNLKAQGESVKKTDKTTEFFKKNTEFESERKFQKVFL